MVHNIGMKTIVTTLCIIHQHPKVLLGMKKRGFGAGRWNGFGGKVKEGETIEQSVRREVEEESGIELTDLEKLGVLDFEFPHNQEIVQVHVFKARDFIGDPVETDEMNPKWFDIDEIPFKEMWPDDVYWMPLFFKDRKFRGRFVFAEGDVIVEKEVNLE